jgi:hypothetical protein
MVLYVVAPLGNQVVIALVAEHQAPLGLIVLHVLVRDGTVHGGAALLTTVGYRVFAQLVLTAGRAVVVFQTGEWIVMGIIYFSPFLVIHPWNP